MYRFYRTVTLVTIASPINQNLALLDADEYLSADSLACIHDGFINLIPLMNTTRRSKYVPLDQWESRGKGIIKQIKWVRINGETVFVVASSIGLQIYDAEICDVKFYHCCKATGNPTSFVNGICVIEKNILCVGTNVGIIWMFQANENNTDFIVIERIHAHDGAISFLDGQDKYLVSSSEQCTYLWTKSDDKQYEISRQLYVEHILSAPSALKISSYFIFIGYESGEFCVFDIFNSDFFVRTIGHKLKITDIDFSPLKHYALTVSEDCYAKVWKFEEASKEGSCIFSVFNENGPLCGGAFLNYNCTEFCMVTINDIRINFYIKNDEINENEKYITIIPRLKVLSSSFLISLPMDLVF